MGEGQRRKRRHFSRITTLFWRSENAIARRSAPAPHPWGVATLGFTELEGRNQDVCYCCASPVRPPLAKGGQGGLKGIASTLGRCDNCAGDSRPGTAQPGCGYAGIPPLPPLLKGGTTRNEIRIKIRLVQDDLFITAPHRSPRTGRGRPVFSVATSNKDARGLSSRPVRPHGERSAEGRVTGSERCRPARSLEGLATTNDSSILVHLSSFPSAAAWGKIDCGRVKRSERGAGVDSAAGILDRSPRL